MKKTVSINIGGAIFHLEEDGYHKLRNYLDSVNSYFSSFEDRKEIMADMENRIAEIFLKKPADGHRTISVEDVEELIATMGTTRDFDATIENEPMPRASKKLYRDARRKMLGGVASGIAHYLSIDPLWVRLLILVLFFNVLFLGISGGALLAYVILWIVMPESAHLTEDKKIKKLFRDPDSRVLGGVASGIAQYFGADVAVIRLLFLILAFFGMIGIILYIMFWIITPEALTVAEKMQMQGGPVTLSDIEDKVKQNLNVKEGENGPIKILLFPFRLMAMIVNGLEKALSSILKHASTYSARFSKWIKTWTNT